VARVAKTAGIVVIGNEILSGKVVDANSPYLCQELRPLGVDVQRIVVLPDDVEVIAEHVAAFASDFDYVLTTGGVGPTHDDVTVEAVAQGLGRQVVIHPELSALLQEHWAERPAAVRDKMASVPEGTQLLMEPSLPIPVLLVGNVYVFPGIPKLFRRLFDDIKERFRELPYHARHVYVRARESTFAHHLEAVMTAFPDLMLGSYPEVDNPVYRVKLTLESKDPAYLKRAHEHLLALLPADVVADVATQSRGGNEA
jgi:molybdenum cofactor synthesis domain-containing protein